MPAKRQKPHQRLNMSENTVTGGSSDSITVSDTVILDLGDYGAGQPALTSSGLSSLSLDDLISTSVTLPTSTYDLTPYTISSTGTGYTYSSSSWSNNATVNIDTNGINIKEGGDIKLGGHSLSDFIKTIEDRLAILKPNPELEDRWEQLKDLRRQYESLEKDILEKEKLMKILKET